MTIDLVCGMQVDEKSALHKSEYEGQVYYFCSSGCKRDFDRSPEKYLHREDPPQTHHQQG